MSAAAPGSADEKSEEPKPESVGFLSKFMSKESSVVSYRRTILLTCLFSPSLPASNVHFKKKVIGLCAR